MMETNGYLTTYQPMCYIMRYLDLIKKSAQNKQFTSCAILCRSAHVLVFNNADQKKKRTEIGQ